MALLTAVVVLFLFSTAYLCTAVSYFVLILQRGLVNEVEVSLIAKSIAFLASFHRLHTVNAVLFPVEVSPHSN